MIGRYWAWTELTANRYPRAFTGLVAVLGCTLVAALAIAFFAL